MQLPSKIAVGAGALIAGGATISQELDLSQPVHKAILLVAGVALFLLNPQASTVAAITRPDTAIKPDGAQIPPPGI